MNTNVGIERRHELLTPAKLNAICVALATRTNGSVTEWLDMGDTIQVDGTTWRVTDAQAVVHYARQQFSGAQFNIAARYPK